MGQQRHRLRFADCPSSIRMYRAPSGCAWGGASPEATKANPLDVSSCGAADAGAGAPARQVANWRYASLQRRVAAGCAKSTCRSRNPARECCPMCFAQEALPGDSDCEEASPGASSNCPGEPSCRVRPLTLASRPPSDLSARPRWHAADGLGSCCANLAGAAGLASLRNGLLGLPRPGAASMLERQP
jgi:hypothetical protein